MLVEEKKDYPETPYRKIDLGNGLFAKVDPDQFEDLNQFKWYAKKSFCRYYAVRAITVDGRKKFIRMHRLIAGTLANEVCHHINGKTLDNRSANLRNMSWFDHTKLHSWR